MKKTTLPFLCLCVTLGLIPNASNAQTPLLYYNFETGNATNNAVVDNLIGGRPDGTLRFGTAGGSINYNNTGTITGTAGTPVAGPQILGRTLTFAPAADGNQNLEAPNIDTAFTATALGITSATAYTAMAWVNFANTSGDNMIFGQDGTPAVGGQVLHNGSRNGNYHSGHWGDDLGPDQGVFVPTGTGVWHHVAYTNNTSGLQSIYVDGVLAAGPGGSNGTAGGMDNAQNVIIGSSNNGGSFAGQLDEIKIFNTELTAAQIQAAARVIPEPTSITLLAVSGLALGLMFRGRGKQR